MSELDARNLGLLVAVGPIMAALVLNALSGDQMNPLWPFHKERAGLAYTSITGGLFCVLPVFHAVKWAAAATS